MVREGNQKLVGEGVGLKHEGLGGGDEGDKVLGVNPAEVTSLLKRHTLSSVP